MKFQKIPFLFFLLPCLMLPLHVAAQDCDVSPPPLLGWSLPFCNLSVSFEVVTSGFNGPIGIQWDFGDDTPLQNNGDHTYDEPGTYEVCVTAFNMTCSDTYCQVISVNAPTPNFNNCPSDISIEVDNIGECNNGTYAPVVTAKKCGYAFEEVPVVCVRSDDPDLGLSDPWPQGITVVTCIATDPDNGLQSTCEWEVYVENISFDILLQNVSSQTNLTEVCLGDPVYFTMDEISTSGEISILWEYNDGMDWVEIPDFQNLTFALPPYPLADEIWFDCDDPSNTNGYIDRNFRATVMATIAGGEICTHQSEEYNLRICCPITDALVQVIPGEPLCEGDIVDFEISLESGHPFLNPPGPEIQIEWKRNGIDLSLPNAVSFSENMFEVGAEDICYSATITNCAGKTLTVSTCIQVDPMPTGGSIIGISPELTYVGFDVLENAHVYQICDGEDAEIGVDEPFDNCVEHWQYSSDRIDWIDIPLGVSNQIQNTNTLFNDDFKPIYYRIICLPENHPDSGCEPIFSDTIRIEQKSIPAMPEINGNDYVCMGESTNLTVSNPDADLSYTWYCNGLSIGTGTSVMADKEACYWVVGTDGCYKVQSEEICLSVCEIQANISCPLPPNECACLGDPIFLSAENSQASSACPGELFFEWSVDGGPPFGGVTIFEHTPDAGGTTYTLTAMDDETGCQHTVSKTIVPCDKN